MKVILLAGGLGTRLSEYTDVRPKPMVEIGGLPILWHVMSIYGSHGFKDFIVACGHKGEVIKEYFGNLRLKRTDFRVDLGSGELEELGSDCPPWRVAVVDTGTDTMTGGRVRRLRHFVAGETFMLTYGDGVGNVDVRQLLAFHRRHGKLGTVTAVRPPARFGALALENGNVRDFAEKPQSESGWINGGFFVFEPGIFDYLGGDEMPLEQEPLERLARDGQLMAYEHSGFWQAMDTVRDQRLLEKYWQEGSAPWKTW
jgi:glucose-1-phosphate cytidylyltransferase